MAKVLKRKKKVKIEPIEIISIIVLTILCVCAVFPFLLMIVASFTPETVLVVKGYSIFPDALSLRAYEYLWNVARSSILRSYGITVFIAFVGTTCGLTVTFMYAYTLSRKEFRPRKVVNFMVFFTLLFQGGLVPTYLMYTGMFNIKNSIFALIVPMLLMKPFYVLLTKSYFITSIPESIIESSTIDGAGTLRTFVSIVIPLSYPILATIGLFIAIDYWNDWFNGMVYITDPKLYSIQNYLNRIITSIQFLAMSPDVEPSAAGDMPSISARMAIAVVGVLPVLILYPFFQKYFRKGITVGAVKG